jgi:hypothetical protein
MHFLCCAARRIVNALDQAAWIQGRAGKLGILLTSRNISTIISRNAATLPTGPKSRPADLRLEVWNTPGCLQMSPRSENPEAARLGSD